MDKATGFLRVFDSSFLLPGAVLAGGWWAEGVLRLETFGRDFNGVPSTMAGVAGLALLTALIYTLGLLLHSLQRVVWRQLSPFGSREELNESSADTSSWYAHLTTERLEELTVYFWYTKATCRNLAVALGVLLATAIVCGLACSCHGLVLVGLGAGAFLFAKLGNDYDGALHRSAERLRQRRPDDLKEAQGHGDDAQ